MNNPAWPIEELETSTEDGRHVAIWRSGPEGTGGRVAFVAPGFCRRMRHMAPVSMYLAEAGFTVYRCDYIDHIGLSHGEVWDFTMTSMYISQDAALKLIAEREGSDATIVAASLANRSVVRLATHHDHVAGIIGIVGVVDARFTLDKVFGMDFVAMEFDELPEEVIFEGKHISVPNWCQDWEAHDWYTLERTAEELRSVRCPVVNFCGTDDDWVKIAHVNEAFAVGDGGPRRLVELPYVEHELSNNPVAGQTLMREVVREALACNGAEDQAAEVAEPSFEAITEQVLYERHLEAEALARRRSVALDGER